MIVAGVACAAPLAPTAAGAPRSGQDDRESRRERECLFAARGCRNRQHGRGLRRWMRAGHRQRHDPPRGGHLHAHPARRRGPNTDGDLDVLNSRHPGRDLTLQPGALSPRSRTTGTARSAGRRGATRRRCHGRTVSLLIGDRRRWRRALPRAMGVDDHRRTATGQHATSAGDGFMGRRGPPVSVIATGSPGTGGRRQRRVRGCEQRHLRRSVQLRGRHRRRNPRRSPAGEAVTESEGRPASESRTATSAGTGTGRGRGRSGRFGPAVVDVAARRSTEHVVAGFLEGRGTTIAPDSASSGPPAPIFYGNACSARRHPGCRSTSAIRWRRRRVGGGRGYVA